MQDNEGLRGAGAADRVRPVALALIETGESRLAGRASLPLPPEGPTVLERLAAAARDVGWVQRVVAVAPARDPDDGAFAEAQRIGIECVRAGGVAAALRALGAPPDQVV